MTAGKTYVIYYGWLTGDARGEPNGAARAIAEVGTPLLIAKLRTASPQPHLNLSPAVLALMRAVGTKVFAYVATSFGKGEAEKAELAIAEALEAGVDGIFFDEVDPLATDKYSRFYVRLSRAVRDAGASVIANPGVCACGERVMETADRLMFEHQWRGVTAASPWARRYAPDRFMGVSSNDGLAMGYALDLERALRDTREAWKAGIGWHTSTERYVELPPWFKDYHVALER